MKVVRVSDEGLEFDNGYKLYDYHDQDCCENHYLDWSPLSLEDFEGLNFDLNTDNFFDRIEDYGIALKPLNGFPVRIAGYGSNNGYYSSNLTLVLQVGDRKINFSISECQNINWY